MKKFAYPPIKDAFDENEDNPVSRDALKSRASETTKAGTQFHHSDA